MWYCMAPIGGRHEEDDEEEQKEEAALHGDSYNVADFFPMSTLQAFC